MKTIRITLEKSKPKSMKYPEPPEKVFSFHRISSIKANSKTATPKALESTEPNSSNTQEISEKVCPMVNVSKKQLRDCLWAELTRKEKSAF